MKLYRMAQTQFASDLTGEGSYRFGGRWNSKGIRMLYTAGNPSLAFLEFLAHLPSWPSPVSTSLITIEIPDVSFAKTDLSHELIQTPNWKTIAQEEGDRFIKEGKWALWKVPSALVPGDFNFLVNPHHPYLEGKIRIADFFTFQPDQRIWKPI